MVVSELYPEAMIDPPGMGYFVLKNQDSGISPILLSVAHHFSRRPTHPGGPDAHGTAWQME